MRGALVLVALLLAGCAEPPVEEARLGTANATSATNATPPTNGTTTAPAVPTTMAPLPDPIEVQGHITLMALGAATPGDRLGLTAPAPLAGGRAVLTMTWDPAIPTAERLAIRVHAPGVLDANGAVVGSSELYLEAAGASPLVAEIPWDLAPDGFDAHAYTPQDDAAPLVANQDFVLRCEYVAEP